MRVYTVTKKFIDSTESVYTLTLFMFQVMEEEMGAADQGGGRVRIVAKGLGVAVGVRAVAEPQVGGVAKKLKSPNSQACIHLYVSSA